MKEVTDPRKFPKRNFLMIWELQRNYRKITKTVLVAKLKKVYKATKVRGAGKQEN